MPLLIIYSTKTG